MKQLPNIMVAPNGARRTKADHPAIPVTIEELVETGRTCFEAGAGAMHAHVRDEDERHVLDAGLYSELIVEMSRQVPQMAVQITTDAVGQYTPSQQRKLVRDVMPKSVSVSLTEMFSDNDDKSSFAFYDWCVEAGIAVQHILYSVEDLKRFVTLSEKIKSANETTQLLFVLGRYAKDKESNPEDLVPFINTLKQENLSADWAVCAFGKAETLCARKAFELGGKCRVGFENSIWHADGSLAVDNSSRVHEVGMKIRAL